MWYQGWRGMQALCAACHLWLVQEVVLAKAPPWAVHLLCLVLQAGACLEPKFAARRLLTALPTMRMRTEQATKPSDTLLEPLSPPLSYS